jgi:hypothetical protein
MSLICGGWSLGTGIGGLGTMKATKELIGQLKSATFDMDNFPRMNSEVTAVQVGVLRQAISILEYQQKELNRANRDNGMVHETTFIDSQG